MAFLLLDLNFSDQYLQLNYYSLLHHTSQTKAITKGEGEKLGVGVFVCAWVCVHVRVCARA